MSNVKSVGEKKRQQNTFACSHEEKVYLDWTHPEKEQITGNGFGERTEEREEKTGIPG